MSVAVRGGRVSGVPEGGLTVFRGIPFAAPPVGDLRFQAPAPPDPWDGVRDATSYGPIPPQSLAVGPMPPTTGDDWLTVNVWTPDVDGHRPVMVWIYGGAYRFGFASDPEHDGSRLAAAQNVVVVTFNHRVGVEGYGQVEGAPANRGLLDCVAALEWVRDHVAAFGGDPSAVTVFGESAGAGAVASLLVMPRARGLFSRAIAQSLPGTFFSPELAADMMREIAARIDRRPTAEDLRDLDPAALVEAFDGLDMTPHLARWGAVALTPTPFSPVVDGDVLPTTPWAGLRDGAARDVTLLAGHNRDEFRLFMLTGGLPDQVDAPMAAMAAGLAPDPAAFLALHDGEPPAQVFEEAWSDWLFRVPSQRLAEAQVEGGGTAFLYELTWPSPALDGALGCCHGLDVPLVWGNLEGGMSAMLVGDPPAPEATEVSAVVQGAWGRFVRGGDPGWTSYDAACVGEFAIGLTETDYAHGPALDVWTGHDFDPLPLTS